MTGSGRAELRKGRREAYHREEEEALDAEEVERDDEGARQVDGHRGGPRRARAGREARVREATRPDETPTNRPRARWRGPEGTAGGRVRGSGGRDGAYDCKCRLRVVSEAQAHDAMCGNG